jgi:hypothetical protein
MSQKLKDSIEILDKRTWMLAAVNRILNICKEVRAAVGEVKSLTKDIGNLLPDLPPEGVEAQTDEKTKTHESSN